MTAQTELESRLDRIERLLLGVADGLATMSGQACLRPVRDDLEAVRADVKARQDG